jgi:hypothetical protein
VPCRMRQRRRDVVRELQMEHERLSSATVNLQGLDSASRLSGLQRFLQHLPGLCGQLAAAVQQLEDSSTQLKDALEADASTAVITSLNNQCMVRSARAAVSSCKDVNFKSSADHALDLFNHMHESLHLRHQLAQICKEYHVAHAYDRTASIQGVGPFLRRRMTEPRILPFQLPNNEVPRFSGL